LNAQYDDEAQAEAIRQWLGDNWKSIVAGLVIGVAAIVGWRQWRIHQEVHMLDASRFYSLLEDSLQHQQSSRADTISSRLIQKYADTVYAVDAQLLMAAESVDRGRYDDAQARLQWVLKNGSDPGTLALAHMRLAQVLWQLNQPSQALAQLDKPDPAFKGLYASLRGDIELDQGHRKAAASAYREALASLGQQSPIRDEVQHKLDALADVPGVTS
jgi:Uncharacterized protein conserved in bacteria